MNFKENLDGNALIISIAHEGRHIADAQAYLYDCFCPENDRTHFDVETRSYNVSSFVAQAIGESPYYNASYDTKGRMQIWNKGWRPADVERKRAAGIKYIISEPPYQYSEDKPGKKYSEELKLSP